MWVLPNKFALKEVCYLGNIILENGIRASLDKISPLEKIKYPPKTLKNYSTF
jgi:hypothetical protein